MVVLHCEHFQSKILGGTTSTSTQLPHLSSECMLVKSSQAFLVRSAPCLATKRVATPAVLTAAEKVVVGTMLWVEQLPQAT